MKYLIIAMLFVAVLAGGYWFVSTNSTSESEGVANVTPESAQTVAAGTYTVRANESTVTWAGKKPLLEGYINAGSIGVSEGTIVVGDATASGSFMLDMNTLSVSATPTKPGQENALESHLKGERWFDVVTYPTATFAITSVAARADSDTTHEYDIVGSLTMKGQIHDVTFPAIIYATDGVLHASGTLAIDRTQWGITAGSANFFDNMADNAIDDMVAISFTLVANGAAE